MNPDASEYYVIRVEGYLDPHWAQWFDGMTLTFVSEPGLNLEEGRAETILSGYVADQAALYGVLNKIRDLNLRLIAVEQSSPRSPGTAGDVLGDG